MMSLRGVVFGLAAGLGLLCRGGPDALPMALPEKPPRATQVRLRGAAIDAAIVEAMQKWQVPGAAVVIVFDDRIEYLAGHGVRQVGHPGKVTPDTIFPLASCSKAFT